METYTVTIDDFKARTWKFTVTENRKTLDDYLRKLLSDEVIEYYNITEAHDYVSGVSAFSQILIAKGIA